MRIAIVPGSFDPMTLGHRSFIEKAASMYDKVVVAVMINANKTPMFDENTRVEIAKLTLSDLSNVEVIFDSGMLFELYQKLGACAVCKGYRNETDLAYEKKMAEWNTARLPNFHTELIPSFGKYANLSSTQIRKELLEGKCPAGIHPNALHLVCSAFQKEYTK